jgi:hypothetical protein
MMIVNPVSGYRFKKRIRREAAGVRMQMQMQMQMQPVRSFTAIPRARC